MRMCFNWKVIAGLAAVGLGIYVVAPGLIASALPVLLVLVCPLSMLLMGGMMGGMGMPAKEDDRMVSVGATAAYSCAMHPDVQQSQHGVCPRCGMSLILLTTPAGRGEAIADREPAPGRDEQLRDLRARLQAVQEQRGELAERIAQLETADLAAPAQSTTVGAARRSTSS